jgi:hypothetical protein
MALLFLYVLVAMKRWMPGVTFSYEMSVLLLWIIYYYDKKHITQHVRLLTPSLEPNTCSCAVACGAHPSSKGAHIGHLLWFSASTVLHG